MSSTVHNLIFDIGGVLILQPKPNWDMVDSAKGMPPGTFQNIVNDCLARQSQDKGFDERSYFARTYSNLISWEDYQKALGAFFSRETLNDELFAWIQDKKRKGLAIYALTNNTASLDRILSDKFRVQDLFDRIFNSAEIGFVKPDPQLFRYLLGEIHADPNTCLFVDDNEQNTRAAQELGFATIHFTDNKSFFSQTSNLRMG